MKDHFLSKLPINKEGFYRLATSFQNESYFALLDSRSESKYLSKFSYITFSPFKTIRSKAWDVWVEDSNGISHYNDSVFEILRKELKHFMQPRIPGKKFPFLGGVIGYFGYELGRLIENLPCKAKDVWKYDNCKLGLYHFVIILDNINDEVFLSYQNPECQSLSLEYIQKKISVALLSFKENEIQIEKNESSKSIESLDSDFTKTHYLESILKVKEYIKAGDIFQANLTQRFFLPFEKKKGWELYNNLMKINPSPFAAYLRYADLDIVCSSPERFWSLCNRQIETRPIKGTIYRDSDQAIDEKLKQKLIKSEKDNAELTMIVDLLRNDLGKICKAGTVKVNAFPEIETYASVHHLVAAITGQLRNDRDVVDILNATFPGGSITGAPKIRAMEIIDEIEPVERGVYTGSIGFIGFDGDADLNIVIRTIILANGLAHIQVGGGIVADSNEESEYLETLLKGKNLAKALFSSLI